MARFGELDTQYFDDAGDPLANGKIYFYDSGTTTPKTTYADVNYTIPNANPVVLTASGRQPNIFFDGSAKAILTDSDDVQILVRDPVGETSSNFGDAWVATRTYSSDDVVLGSDGEYYRSLVAANQNNDPTSTSGYWSLLYSVEWDSGITYQTGATVTYNGISYQSVQDSNTNQNPESTTGYWVPSGLLWLDTYTYASGETVLGSDGSLYVSLQGSNLDKDPTDVANAAWWVQSGDFRGIPSVGAEKTAAYTLQASDAGFLVTVGNLGSIEIPDATFSAGDVVNLYNNTTGSITITCTITTAYISGVNVDQATVSLATRGLASVYFISDTVCVISGPVT